MSAIVGNDNRPGRNERRPMRSVEMKIKRETWKAALADPRAPVWDRIEAAQALSRFPEGWALVLQHIRDETVPIEARVRFAEIIGYAVKRKPREIVLYHRVPHDRHTIKTVEH